MSKKIAENSSSEFDLLWLDCLQLNAITRQFAIDHGQQPWLCGHEPVGCGQSGAPGVTASDETEHRKRSRNPYCFLHEKMRLHMECRATILLAST